MAHFAYQNSASANQHKASFWKSLVFCGFLNEFLVSSRRALHRATSSYDPSTSRRYYSSKVNSKSKKSKCLRGPIGPTGPEGPTGPPGPPGVCPSTCPTPRTQTYPVKRNLLEKKIEKAAFQIALSNSAYTTLESVVVWDTIITNRGNMFSLSSGIFTASKPGKNLLLLTSIWPHSNSLEPSSCTFISI